MEPLKNLVKELTDRLNSKEDEWKNLRQKITKAETLQEVVMFEMKNSMQSPRKPSKMEALKQKVSDMEQIVKRLEEVCSRLFVFNSTFNKVIIKNIQHN